MRLPIVCALLMVVGATAGHGQQRDTLPRRDPLSILGLRVRGEIGVVLGHDVQGGSTLTGPSETDPGFIARGAIEYRFRHGLGTFAMLGGSLARVTDTRSGETGTTTHVDVMAGLSWRPPIRQAEPEPVTLHVAGGAALISGPEDISPYRMYADEEPFGIWEVGISIHPVGSFGATVAYQTIEVPPPVEVEEQPIHRIVLAVRVGRS